MKKMWLVIILYTVAPHSFEQFVFCGPDDVIVPVVSWEAHDLFGLKSALNQNSNYNGYKQS